MLPRRPLPRAACSKASITRRACSSSCCEGENTRLQVSICAGWISVLPSKPSRRASRHSASKPGRIADVVVDAVEDQPAARAGGKQAQHQARLERPATGQFLGPQLGEQIVGAHHQHAAVARWPWRSPAARRTASGVSSIAQICVCASARLAPAPAPPASTSCGRLRPSARRPRQGRRDAAAARSSSCHSVPDPVDPDRHRPRADRRAQRTAHRLAHAPPAWPPARPSPRGRGSARRPPDLRAFSSARSLAPGTYRAERSRIEAEDMA